MIGGNATAGFGDALLLQSLWGLGRAQGELQGDQSGRAGRRLRHPCSTCLAISGEDGQDVGLGAP